MAIIISRDGKSVQKVNKSNFETEDYLQNYIHKNPESIPVYEIAEDKKLFVVKREFATNAGPIDALAIDKDGDIYIIETKLYKNPDKRTVVAQALDYGAALWRHLNDFNEFMATLDQECQKNFNQTFKEKSSEFFQLEDKEIEMQLETMRTNLNNGNLKFVILMDVIEERLKDLIVYINQNSQFDIYAVQLEYYKFKEYEIMIPKMFGVEVKKNIKKTVGARRRWNEQDFILQVKKDLGDHSKKIVDLYYYLKEKSDKINWGTGNVKGSFSPVFYKISKTISPFSFYTNGEIMIKFNWLKDTLKEDDLKKYITTFREELERQVNLKIPEKDLWRREPIIPSKKLTENHEGIKNVIDKCLKMFDDVSD